MMLLGRVAVPVSSDGDGKTVVLLPRILHARHFGIDSEAISGFAVELLQKTNRRPHKQPPWGFTADRPQDIKEAKQKKKGGGWYCAATKGFNGTNVIIGN